MSALQILEGGGAAHTKDVGQTDFQPLVRGDVYSDYYVPYA